MKNIILAFLLLGCLFSAAAATVDTLDTYSARMKKNIKAVVVRPEKYDELSEMPVVYLLHGYSDSYNGWIKKVPDIQQASDLHNIIIVCPDGGFSSWYWDSPVDSSIRYESYIINELVPFIDKKFKTVKNRKGRGITGLSMGGHGALYLGFRHQDVFGAAGSMSGGVDIRPFPNNWDMAKRLGTYAQNPEYWEKYTVANLLHLLTPGSLAISIECGTGDFFFAVNEKLHEALLLRNIPHDYTTRPGVHNWDYWKNAVHFQLLFMHNYFTNGK